MKKRIIIGLGLILFIFCIGGIFIVFSIETSRAEFDRIIRLHQIQILRNNLLLSLEQVQTDIYLYRLHRSHSARDRDELLRHVDTLAVNINNCFVCHHTEAMNQRLVTAKEMIGDYRSRIHAIMYRPGNLSEMESREDEVAALGNRLLDMFHEIVATASVRLSEKTAATFRYANRVEIALYTSLALGLAMAVFLAFRFEGQLMKPVKEILKGAENFSQGNLGYRIPDNRMPRELSLIASSFNRMAKELTEHLERTKTAEQSELMREIAAGLAHEIKNPLAGIKGALEIFMHELDLSQEDRAVFEEMLFQVKKLDVMTKCFVEYARPPSPQIVPTNANDIIRNTVSFVTRQKLHRNLPKVEIIERLDQSMPLIHADPMQIQQVLMNLMINALDAMPDGGRIEFRTSHHDGVAEIEVADTGHGIDEELLNNIFKPFFTTKVKGMGIGLSICKKLIEQHSGTITVNSGDSGTLFRITLPKA